MPLFFLLLNMLCIAIAALVWLSWMIVASLPVVFSIAIFIYVILRERRRQAEHWALLQKEAESGRQLNEQEFRAWRGVLEDDRRRQAKRTAALKRFDDQNRR